MPATEAPVAMNEGFAQRALDRKARDFTPRVEMLANANENRARQVADRYWGKTPVNGYVLDRLLAQTGPSPDVNRFDERCAKRHGSIRSVLRAADRATAALFKPSTRERDPCEPRGRNQGETEPG